MSLPQLQLLAKLKINDLVQSAGVSDARLLYLLEKQSIENDIKLDECKLDIDNEILNASEYINVKIEGTSSDIQQKYVEGSDDEEDEDWEWVA